MQPVNREREPRRVIEPYHQRTILEVWLNPDLTGPEYCLSMARSIQQNLWRDVNMLSNEVASSNPTEILRRGRDLVADVFRLSTEQTMPDMNVTQLRLIQAAKAAVVGLPAKADIFLSRIDSVHNPTPDAVRATANLVYALRSGLYPTSIEDSGGYGTDEEGVDTFPMRSIEEKVKVDGIFSHVEIHTKLHEGIEVLDPDDKMEAGVVYLAQAIVTQAENTPYHQF